MACRKKGVVGVANHPAIATLLVVTVKCRSAGLLDRWLEQGGGRVASRCIVSQ